MIGISVNCRFTGFLPFFIFSCIFDLGAQQPANPYALVDQKARHIPSAYTVSTEKMAAYINDHFHNDDEKIRAIYTWIASNIDYDCKLAKSGSEEKITGEEVLAKRKTIASGYAALFVACAFIFHLIAGAIPLHFTFNLSISAPNPPA